MLFVNGPAHGQVHDVAEGIMQVVVAQTVPLDNAEDESAASTVVTTLKHFYDRREAMVAGSLVQIMLYDGTE